MDLETVLSELHFEPVIGKAVGKVIGRSVSVRLELSIENCGNCI